MSLFGFVQHDIIAAHNSLEMHSDNLVVCVITFPLYAFHSTAIFVFQQLWMAVLTPSTSVKGAVSQHHINLCLCIALPNLNGRSSMA